MTLLSRVPVGITGLPSTFNQDVLALIPKRGLRAEFLARALLAREMDLRRLVERAGHGTGRLSARSLRSLEIAVPPEDEQDAIASVLTAWDRMVSGTDSLLAAKQRFKRGLMQQLLTGKRRFKESEGEAWSAVHLGDVFEERVETGRADLPLLSITADRGVIPRDEVERRDTSNADKSEYLRIAPGDIGYNTMRMWQGVSALSELEGIVSPAYTICVPGERVDGEFAAHLFKLPAIVDRFRRYSQGLVDDTLNLKYHHFAQVRIQLPPVPEQRAIATVLTALDRELSLLERLRDALDRQRRGVMELLLTGKVRVPA